MVENKKSKSLFAMKIMSKAKFIYIFINPFIESYKRKVFNQ